MTLQCRARLELLISLCQASLSPGSEEGESGVVRMLYPSMAIFSHSCSPNTQALHRPDYGLTLTTTRTIRAGEEITVTYTELWGSAVHRKQDINNWFFQCSCERCQDQEVSTLDKLCSGRSPAKARTRYVYRCLPSTTLKFF